MSQFTPPSYADPTAGAVTEPPKTSATAVWSLICSLVFCCPVTTVIGVLLGLVAMVSIGGNPARKGKGLAITGILLGVIFTAGQLIAYPAAYKFFYQFYEVVMKGPNDALIAGFNGDTAVFKASFYGAGATASDEEAVAFIAELRERYGEFQMSRFDEQGGSPPQAAPGQANVPFPYILDFDNATVNTETEIIFADPAAGGGFINKLGYIKVFDADRGDLTYPAPSDDP